MKIRNVTVDEVIEYFTSKGVRSQCMNCGCPEAAIDTDPNSDTVTVFGVVRTDINDVTGKGTFDLTKGMAFICDECVNCGYIRHFALTKILEWLSSGKTEK